MPDYILKAYNEIRKLRSEGMRQNARHGYDIALRVKRVWECKPEYGQQAMKQLAAALGWSTSTAYRYKDVAETFTSDEFARILDRSDEFGRPLRWLHFIELTRVETDEERQMFLDAVLNDGLSGRQLGKLIGNRSRKKRRPKKTNSSFYDDTLDLTLESEAFANDVQLNTIRLAQCFEHIKSRIARQAHREEVTKTLNGLLRVICECQKGIERLDECLHIDDDHEAAEANQSSTAMSQLVVAHVSAEA